MAMRMSTGNLSSNLSRLLRFGRSFSSIPRQSSVLSLMSSQQISGILLLHQSARSMVGWWQKPIGGSMSKLCGCGPDSCCQIHTESDQQLLNFLSKEIKLESENKKSLPKVTDFSIATDDSNVTLTKTLGNEKITVKFNVNHSVNSSEVAEEEMKEPQMVSKPPFTVEISKGDRTLAMSCVFNEDIVDPQTGEADEQYAATLEIEEVCLHGGEWNEQTYAVSASTMDGTLYDYFLNLLEDRGIDEQFVEQLIDYSTNYEHHKYINFLQNLQGFIQK